MLLARRDFRTHPQYLDSLLWDEALVLAGNAARHHDHVTILAGVEQRLIEPRGKSENDDEDHRDQRDAEYRHQRRRAPLDNAADVVANRHHRKPLIPIGPDRESILTRHHINRKPRHSKDPRAKGRTQLNVKPLLGFTLPWAGLNPAP